MNDSSVNRKLSSRKLENCEVSVSESGRAKMIRSYLSVLLRRNERPSSTWTVTRGSENGCSGWLRAPRRAMTGSISTASMWPTWPYFRPMAVSEPLPAPMISTLLELRRRRTGRRATR